MAACAPSYGSAEQPVEESPVVRRDAAAGIVGDQDSGTDAGDGATTATWGPETVLDVTRDPAAQGYVRFASSNGTSGVQNGALRLASPARANGSDYVYFQRGLPAAPKRVKLRWSFTPEQSNDAEYSLAHLMITDGGNRRLYVEIDLRGATGGSAAALALFVDEVEGTKSVKSSNDIIAPLSAGVATDYVLAVDLEALTVTATVGTSAPKAVSIARPAFVPTQAFVSLGFAYCYTAVGVSNTKNAAGRYGSFAYAVEP
jgi:hypothetical protein